MDSTFSSQAPVQHRMVVGLTGASGIVFGVKVLQLLRTLGVESHLVMTRAAQVTRAQETELTDRQIHDMADVNYAIGDIGAAISSGSFRTMGMIVAPCSINSLSEIAAGTTSNLLTRAADVTLKERRRLVLLVRETPLTLGHIRSMAAATESGAIIAPPVPAFYMSPKSIDDIVTHTAARALDLFGLHVDIPRWREPGRATQISPSQKGVSIEANS
jgi:4-hydroxy-3-polyprenylbenzoate decarboxylase